MNAWGKFPRCWPVVGVDLLGVEQQRPGERQQLLARPAAATGAAIRADASPLLHHGLVGDEDQGQLIDYHPSTAIDRNWTALAVHRLEADSRRSADTHLVKLPLAGPVDLYLKDESTHPTGSLKHRLARSLFLYALCNGWIGPATTVVEASSGSTAVSEAYFARLIGVPRSRRYRPNVAAVPPVPAPTTIHDGTLCGSRAIWPSVDSAMLLLPRQSVARSA